MIDDINAIVRGLTKAQREVLASSELLIDGRVLIDAVPPHGLNSHLTNMYSYARDCLTPLGLAVCQRIIEQERERG